MTVTITSYDELRVCVAADIDGIAVAAADAAVESITAAIAQRGSANVMLATGNSQLAFLDELATRDVEWSAVAVLHMDEYVGIDDTHPASFARYIRERVVDVVQPGAAYLMNSRDVAAEIDRYTALLRDHPLDVTCLGIGENGHLAFNDPPYADFDDPVDLKEVELDEASRRQQVGEGHFADIGSVPRTAITVTIPALLRAGRVLAVVPEARKAAAVRAALTGPITTDCPASILRRTPHATLFLDRGSAALL